MKDDEPTDPMPDDRDGERDSKGKTKASAPWLGMLKNARAGGFATYHDKANSVEKRYADLERLSSVTRDREFQIFWANLEVLKPSIYSRPPVPVVIPRFKSTDPVKRLAAEILERATIVAFELEDINEVMLQVRDDLATIARGCVWVRFESKDETPRDEPERVCVEYVNRVDFLHDPARVWKEVDWVAKRSFLSQDEMRKRFKGTSKLAYLNATYSVRKDNDGDDGSRKAEVWELWCRSKNKVAWISEGLDVCLDIDKPHLMLDGFFPCPRPAYATVQRGSLIPVPDYVYYKDQIEEIETLTSRISALADGLRLRGFYPAGAGEIGDAIEAAIKRRDDSAVLVPISNWALLGGAGASQTIVWLPLDQVASTITQLIGLRRQMIDDIYQITGLSDIMRGSTKASETLGAQQLKSQYGSVRVRDRQEELVRLAKDTTRIVAEIMSENFKGASLASMAQMDVKTDAEVKKEIKPFEDENGALEAEAKQLQNEVGLAEQLQKEAGFIVSQMQAAESDPEIQAMAQQNPQQAEQIMGQAQQRLGEIQQRLEAIPQIQQRLEAIPQRVDEIRKEIDIRKDIPTIEKVVKLLRDQHVRPFVLDIESDSTISADENAQKQRATEYVSAIGGFLAQSIPLAQGVPQIAPLMAETLKFLSSQFRAGREMQSTIDEFADQMKAMASQPKPEPEPQEPPAGPPPEDQAQAELQKEQMKIVAENERRRQDLEMRREEQANKMQFEGQLATAKMNTEKEVEAMKLGTTREIELRKIEAEQMRPPPAPVPPNEDSSRMQMAILESILAVQKSNSLPKRIVRGPDGKAIGVETVQ